LGGAVFDDHQDRHAEVQHGQALRWTVTLVVASEGPGTGFFLWNNRHPGGACEEPPQQPRKQPRKQRAHAPAAAGGGAAAGGADPSSAVVADRAGSSSSGTTTTATTTTTSAVSGGGRGGESVRGVLPYGGAGSGVLFSSMAWHRSVLPAAHRWPFQVKGERLPSSSRYKCRRTSRTT
jgi:hypothetical protein